MGGKGREWWNKNGKERNKEKENVQRVEEKTEAKLLGLITYDHIIGSFQLQRTQF